MDVDRLLHPHPAAEVRLDHVRLHRPGTEQRDVDDQVLPPGGLELLEQLALARRLDLEAAERVRGADQLERRDVVGRDPVQVDLLTGGPRDLVQRVAHRREHPDAQDVEFQVAQQLDVVLVGLDHPVTVRAPLERHPVDQLVVRQDDAARVQRDVTREAVQPLGHAEQQLELGHGQVDAVELREAVDRLAEMACRDVRERLRHDPELGVGQAERLAHLADRRTRPVRIDHGDAGGAVVTVAREHHVVDVLAPCRLHVDVDVRWLVAHRVHEPLERQVVADRVHVGDGGEVTDERARRRAPAGAADAHRLDVRDDVGHGQEERRRAHLVDHRELVLESSPHRLRGVHVPILDPPVTPIREHRCGAPPFRHREVREMHPLQPQVEHARLRDRERGVAELRPLGEQRPHRTRRLQPAFGVLPTDVVLRDRHDLPHALERVGEERVLGHQVAHGVGRDGRDLEPLREPQHRPHLIVRRTFHPMLHRHEASISSERLPERLGSATGLVDPAGGGQPSSRRPRPEQHDQTCGVRTDL